MKNKSVFNTHYLSISYKVLLSNRKLHYFLFTFEMYLVLVHLLEIYYIDFKSCKLEDVATFNVLTLLIRLINKIPNAITCAIYLIIIIILTINYYILNMCRIKKNYYVKIMVNISELIFYRTFCIFLFDFLFFFEGIYLFICVVATFPFIYILISHFLKHNLTYFFPKIIQYPYDPFSRIIDLNLIFIKIFLSLSDTASNAYISKLFFILSIIILFILLVYLTYLIIQKSYYLMNNIKLNKIRYSIILAIFIIIMLFLILIDHNTFNNSFYYICMFNITILCLLVISYFYNPYHYCKFDKDDNIENVYYYFFILDRDENNFLLLEQLIEDHITNCRGCSLCTKYNNIKSNKNNKEIDLYSIIFNGKNAINNLFNFLIRDIKKYVKDDFIDNSCYLINLKNINYFQRDNYGIPTFG